MLKEASGEGCKREQWCLGERLNPTGGLGGERVCWCGSQNQLSGAGVDRQRWDGKGQVAIIQQRASWWLRAFRWCGSTVPQARTLGAHTSLSYACLGGFPLPWETVSVWAWADGLPSLVRGRHPLCGQFFPGFVFLSSSQLQVRASSRNPPGLCTGVLQRNRTNRIYICLYDCFIFVVVQLLSHAWFSATPWTVAHQASLSITISWSLLRLMSIELVYHPTISSSVVLFSSCLQSFPASGSFLMIVLYMYMYKATVSGIPIFIYVYKTYCSGEVSLLFDSDLQLIGWGPPTFWRPICFTQPTNKNVTLIQKHPHRDIQNNAWPTIWVPWPSQVEAYSHHRLFLV